MPSAIHEGFVEVLIASKTAAPAGLDEQRLQLEALLQDPSVEAAVETLNIGALPVDRVRAPCARDGAVIVHCHGGGYVIGSRQSHRAFAGRLSAATGLPVLLPDYRLAPEHVYPAPVDDVLAVLDWLGQSGVDPARVVLSGDSAGGGLILSVLLALKEAGRPLPAAAVCLSPWVDLAIGGASAAPGVVDDPLLDAAALGFMASLYAPGKADLPGVSPLRGDLGGLPPLLVMAGTREVLVDDARRLVEKARRSGVTTEYLEAPGLIHCWPVLVPMAPESAQALERIASFIAAQLDRAGVPAK